MCSTDVYRVHRVEEDDPEEAEEKAGVELVSAKARLLEAVISLAK
jgi:hypothetical protein